MDLYFQDSLYFTCSVCCGDDVLEVDMEEPRWHNDRTDDIMTTRVDFSISTDWGKRYKRQRIKKAWRILRGKTEDDNTVSLNATQASVLAWRLKHWVMYGDFERTELDLPDGIRRQLFGWEPESPGSRKYKEVPIDHAPTPDETEEDCES